MSIWERRLYEISCDHLGCDDVWIGGASRGLIETWGEALEEGWQFVEDEPDLAHAYFCPEHKAIN